MEQPITVVDAVYEDGVFRPLRPVNGSFVNGQRIRIIMQPLLSPEEMTELAASVYEGLTDEEVAEVEKIALDRSNFFGYRAST